MAGLVWDTIMENSTTMKQLVENKISEEVAKKQTEIDQLNTDKDNLQSQIDTLALEILTLMGV